jgi:hypothetical protein
LQTIWEAEKALTGDAQAERWVLDLRPQAERAQHNGRDALFGKDPMARAAARGQFEEALAAYERINHALRLVQEAQRCRDEMQVRLEDYAPYLEIDRRALDSWGNAVAVTCQLRDLLAAPVPPTSQGRDEQLRQMEEWTQTLNDPKRLNSLLQGLQPDRFQSLIGRRGVGDLADATTMTAWLETSLPRPQQREILWSARWDLYLAQRNRSPSVGVQAPESEGRAVDDEHARALRRARISVAVLHLQGAKGLGKLEEALAQAAAAKPFDAGRLQALEEQLRQAWGRSR